MLGLRATRAALTASRAESGMAAARRKPAHRCRRKSTRNAARYTNGSSTTRWQQNPTPADQRSRSDRRIIIDENMVPSETGAPLRLAGRYVYRVGRLIRRHRRICALTAGDRSEAHGTKIGRITKTGSGAVGITAHRRRPAKDQATAPIIFCGLSLSEKQSRRRRGACDGADAGR